MSDTDQDLPPQKQLNWLVTGIVVLVSLAVAVPSLIYVLRPEVLESNRIARDDAELSNTQANSSPGEQRNAVNVPGPEEWRALPEGHHEVPLSTTAPKDLNQEAGTWLIKVDTVSSQPVEEPTWTAYLVARGSMEAAPRAVHQKAAGHSGKGALFDGVPAGRYDVQVRADGWVAQDQFDVSYDGEYTETVVELFRFASLTCHVHDKEGQPVDGATVALYPKQRLFPFFDRNSKGQSESDKRNPDPLDDFKLFQTTGDDGVVHFANLPPSGDYWLLAGGTDYATRRINGIQIAAGSDEMIEIVLEAGAFIVGTVVQYDGDPVAGATVKPYRRYDPAVDAEITVGHSGTARAIGWIQEGITRASDDGRFRHGPLSAGKTRIDIRHSKDGVELQVRLTIDLQPGEVRDLGVIRPEFPPLELVFICDGFDRPDDLHVMLNPQPLPEHRDKASASGLINLDVGVRDRAIIQNLPPGSAILVVRSWSNSTKLVEQRIDNIGLAPKTVEIQLSESVEVRAPHLSIGVTPPPEDNSFFGLALISPESSPAAIRYLNGLVPASTDKGAFAKGVGVKTRDPGIHTLWATDGTRTAVQHLTVNSGDDDSEISIHLDEPAGALKFEVRGPDGVPVPGATIDWFWDETHMLKSSFDKPYLRELTDGTGVTLVRGFPKDHPELHFRIRADGYKSKSIQTQSGTTVSSPRLEIVWLERS